MASTFPTLKLNSRLVAERDVRLRDMRTAFANPPNTVQDAYRELGERRKSARERRRQSTAAARGEASGSD